MLYFLLGPARGYITRIQGQLIIKNKIVLNLEVVKLTTVQVTRQPLQHKILKISMICSAKPVLTEDWCVVQEQEFFQ
jgi:hypothetical protein